MNRLELAEAMRRTASIVITEEYGSRANADALAVMRYADELDRPITQTAIVAGLGGQNVLVRLTGVHVPASAVQVDTAPVGGAWRPVAPERIDVRHE